jgi:hypothetical protein
MHEQLTSPATPQVSGAVKVDHAGSGGDIVSFSNGCVTGWPGTVPPNRSILP